MGKIAGVLVRSSFLMLSCFSFSGHFPCFLHILWSPVQLRQLFWETFWWLFRRPLTGSGQVTPNWSTWCCSRHWKQSIHIPSHAPSFSAKQLHPPARDSTFGTFSGRNFRWVHRLPYAPLPLEFQLHQTYFGRNPLLPRLVLFCAFLSTVWFVSCSYCFYSSWHLLVLIRI